MPTTKQFKSFERRADSDAESLVRGKPVRSVATLLNVGAAMLTLGPQVADQKNMYRRGVGVTRFGYLMPLLQQANPKFAGVSAYDAIGAWGHEDSNSIAVTSHLYAYSEFCECAPFVHRGALLETSDELHVELRFPTVSYAAVEQKDIILSNLFNAFSVYDGRLIKSWCDEKSAAPDKITLTEMFNAAAQLVPWFREWYMELSPLSEAAMQAAVGVSTATFVSFRAACLALAELHTSLLAAIFRKIDASKSNDFALAIQEEMMNLMSPCWSIEFTHDLISRLAHIDIEDVEKLMTVYSAVAGSGDSRAEGFAPPFIASEENYIFGPVVAQHMMSSRNILYTCIKRDAKNFDDHVSQHLEPQLISTAREILLHLDDVKIATNFEWEAGELDMVVYRPSDNAVLVIEAKAALAPEGARLVERTEGRIIEGLDQLNRFANLTPEQQDQILSNALGRKVRNVHVSSFILAWAGFGTENVWSRFHAVTPLNIALLSHLVLTSPKEDLKTFASLAQSLISELMTAANAKWVNQKRDMGDLSFTGPTLEFNGESFVKYQMAPFKVLKRNTNWA